MIIIVLQNGQIWAQSINMISMPVAKTHSLMPFFMIANPVVTSQNVTLENQKKIEENQLNISSWSKNAVVKAKEVIKAKIRR